MLKVDLGRLKSGARQRIDEEVPAADPLWSGSGLNLAGPVSVRLEAENAAGDILVRGYVSGVVELPCRRCLVPGRAGFEEPITLRYRSLPAGAVAVDDDEAYAVPERAREVELGPAIREHVLLAAPEYRLCREDCRGLCPHCGTDLNLGTCTCGPDRIDERWAALRSLRPD
jgi:uncharacterized protein